MVLFCATSNRHKLAEFRTSCGDSVIIRKCPVTNCPETGDTFEANALQKAACYYRAVAAEWLFADDSGLAVDALDGAPGICSARYAGPGCSDDDNNRLLVRKLQAVPDSRRTARFICAIALLHNGRLVKTFRGEAEGLILRAPAGTKGFGYDPLFHFPPLGTSFGCVDRDLKWLHSHRGKAFRSMMDWLLSK